MSKEIECYQSEMPKLFGSGRLPDDVSNPVESLLAIEETMYMSGNRDKWYGLALGTHLLKAFEVWKLSVREDSQNNDMSMIHGTMNALDGQDKYKTLWRDFWGNLNHVAPSFFRGGEPIISFHDLLLNFEETKNSLLKEAVHSFSASVWSPRVLWTKDTLIEAYDTWLDIVLKPKSWADTADKMGVPFALELPHPNKNMPTAMILGGIPYDRRFDRWYVSTPIARTAPYNTNLWDYLAPSKYEESSDLEYKKNVFWFLMGENYEQRPTSKDFSFARVLDVGQGTGLLGAYLPPSFKLYGIDLSEVMCDRARERQHGDGSSVYEQIVHGDAQAIEYPDNYFRVAVMSHVEIWMNKLGLFRSLNEIHRVLESGGRLYLHVHKPVAGEMEMIVALMEEVGFWDVKKLQGLVRDGVGDRHVVHKIVAYAASG